MPKILTYNTPPNVEKKRTKQSIFKSFFDYFNSQDKFTKLYLITFALIILATPFIVSQYLNYLQRAEQNQQQQNPVVPIEVDKNCIIKSVISIEELADKSSVIVQAKVESIDSEWREDKNIWSKVGLKKTETLKGKDEEKFVINTYGGTVGNITEIAGCYPKFSMNEEVLLFLKEDKKNPQAFEVTEGFQGKFSVKDGQASRGIRTEKLTNQEVKDRVKNKNPKKESYKFNRLKEIVSELKSILVRDVQAAFTLTSPPYRRFPADIPVGYYMDINPNPSVGQSTYDVARGDLSMWSNARANISLQDRGIIDNHNVASDGKNMLIFNDFNNIMGDGFAALTFIWFKNDASMIVNNTTFYQLLESDIVVNSKAGTVNTPQLLANVLGHELGHTIGLGHDTIDNNAIMSVYGVIGEGAVLHQDDLDGVRFIYPNLPPPPPPTLISPIGTAPAGTNTFSWNPVTGAAGYYFRITSNSTIGCGRAGDYCPGPQTTTSATYNLTAGTNYIWWVHSYGPTSDNYGAYNSANVTAAAPTPSTTTIAGHVKNSVTGAGISGVEIQVYDDTLKQTQKPTTDANGYWSSSNFVRVGDGYAVYVYGNQVSPQTAPAGYSPPAKTTTDGWTWQAYCGILNNTPLGFTAYNCQTAGSSDCAGPNGSGTTQRCDFAYNPTPLPIDSDKDGFPDSVENYIGTNPYQKCQTTTTPGMPNSAWPPDLNGDNKVDIFDVIRLSPPVFGSHLGESNYKNRYDLNADKVIDKKDVDLLQPYFFKTCT